MDSKTKVIVGYIGVGLAAALIAGAAVWAIMSARVSDAERSGEAAEERIERLESQVASMTASLSSAEASLAARSEELKATEPTAATTGKTPATSDVARQFCFMRGGTWEGSTPYLSVDYAELLSGDEAAAAATAHGSESPPPNDYYIVNDNPKLRSIPADPNMTVKAITKSDGMVSGGYSIAFGQWFDVLIGMSGDDFVKDRPYWITVKDGTITAIEEQYLP